MPASRTEEGGCPASSLAKRAKSSAALRRIALVGRFLVKDFKRNRYIYLMAVPVLLFYVVFHYLPIYGATIAFKDFRPAAGILGSPWVGFKHFASFFRSYYFLRVLRNTILLRVYHLFWSFPAPIVLALLLNELRSVAFKRTVQTVTYIPHFISLVVICGLVRAFVASDGVITQVFQLFGGQRSNLLLRPELFRTIFISSGIWQEVGWGSIIFLAALSGIDPQLYEAATIDGAGRWRKMCSITLPGILPTIIILLILRIGRMMTVGYEKVLLLYNPTTYEVADVISTFVYRKGILQFDWSYAAAVGLFNSAINFCLLLAANRISKKVSETSLW